MANLYEIQKQRLKLYGQMLKNDLNQKRAQQRLQKQANQKRDSIELQMHIENTKKFDQYKRQEIRDLNNALKEDNMMLTSLKKNASFTSSPIKQGPSFINQIHQLDSKRLNKLKNDLELQFHDNKDFSTSKQKIEQKLKEIQRLESDRHTARVKQMQMDSIRSYQQIKRKHQQDMNLYDKHRQLVEKNQSYRDQIQSFTQGKDGRGLLDRYNRNQYLQRRASLRQNQEQIVKQIEELERRRSQEIIDYKKNVGNLEESMLASVLSKPPRYQPRAYSNELKSQMQIDSLKKLEQESAKKEKMEISGIFGGMHGSERHRMIQIIDKRLGIDRYSQQNREKRNQQLQFQNFKYN